MLVCIVWPHLSEVKHSPNSIYRLRQRDTKPLIGISVTVQFVQAYAPLLISPRTSEQSHFISICSKSQCLKQTALKSSCANISPFSRDLTRSRERFSSVLRTQQALTSLVSKYHEKTSRGSRLAAALWSSVPTKRAAVIYSSPCLYLLAVILALPSWKVIYVNQLLTGVTGRAAPEKMLCLTRGGECLETWPESK